MGVMSYNVKVTAKDGTATVEVSGDLPDGLHVITGHQDASQTSLSVTRSAEDGRPVLSASTSTYKEG